MTDDELRELVAANSRAIGRLEGLQEENARQWQLLREENRASREEDARQWQLLREENRASREESERRWEEHREKLERVWEEIRASRVDTDRVITSIEDRLDAIHRELGGIGKTLGGVSEGLCRPAVARICATAFT